MSFQVSHSVLGRMGHRDYRKRKQYIDKLHGSLHPFVSNNMGSLCSEGTGQIISDSIIAPMTKWAIPELSNSDATQLAAAYVNDMIVDPLSTSTVSDQGLVATAGITPGSTLSGGVNGIVSSTVGSILSQLGLSGYTASGLGLAISSILNTAVTNALGSGQLLTSGLAPAIAASIAATVTATINSYSPVPIPQTIVQTALSSALNYILQRVIDSAV